MRIGEYELGDALHEDKVWLACRGVEKFVLKLQDPAFPREDRLLKHLDHPSIVQYFETFEHCWRSGEVTFYVLEYISGENLYAKAAHRGLRPEEFSRTACAMTGAVEYLRNKDIVHNDLKPSNWIDTGDAVKLIDFDVARFSHEAGGNLLGSLGFASPEQMLGYNGLSNDLYTLGATWYFMRTGESPTDIFPFEWNWKRILQQLRQGPSGPLSSGVENDLIMRLLAGTPERRATWDDVISVFPPVKAPRSGGVSRLESYAL